MERLADRQRSEVLRLVRIATRVDQVAPLSEHVLLAAAPNAQSPGGSPTGNDVAADTGSSHFLAYVGTHLAGYAHLERDVTGPESTAEVVVDPAHRRQGIGTALVKALRDALTEPHTEPLDDSAMGALEDSPAPRANILRIWAHGHLEAARAFALRDGFSIIRELWQMRRSLASDSSQDGVGSLPATSLPEGFRSRRFVVGRDEDAWLRLNARAFVDHPEQGRITRPDLDLRMAEPWFDANGLILIEDTRGLAPVLAASHWTKVVPSQVLPSEVSALRPSEGEVYVVGVDPAYQGLGLGLAVTVLGLVHLREQGLTEAMLYVDADNRAAVATYSRLGFVRCAVDVMYSSARSSASVKIGP